MAGSRWEAQVGAAVAEVAPTSALRVASIVAPSTPALLDPYLDEGALGRRVEVSTEVLSEGVTTRLERTSRRPYHDVCTLVVGEALSSAGIHEGCLDLALVDPSATPWLGELFAALASGGILLAFDAPAVRAALRGLMAEVSSVGVDGVVLLIVRRDRPRVGREQAPWSTLDRCACVDRDRVAAVLDIGAPSQVREVPEWAELRRRLAAAVAGRAGDPALGAALLGDALTLARTPERPAGDPSADADAEPARVDLLLLVPHPDDETVYFGGVVAAACRAGLHLRVATLTGGEGGLDLRGVPGATRVGSASVDTGRGGSGPALAQIRADEQARALEALGAGECARQGLGFADTGKYVDRRRAQPMTASEALARWGHEELVDRLVELFRQVRPRAVVTMDAIRDPNYSLHAHHLGCGAAALVAVGLAEDGTDPLSSPVSLWTIQPTHVSADLRSRGQADGSALPGAAISQMAQVVEIPVDLDRKIAALAAYPSQGYSTQRLIASLERARTGGEGVYEVLLQRARLSLGSDPIQLLLGSNQRSA